MLIGARRMVVLGGRWYPSWLLKSGSAHATLDADFVNDRVWNGRLSSVADLLACARATPAAAYYTKADGTLTTFAADTLRYGTNGLLVEEERTNVAQRSQEIDNAYWSLNQATIAADAAVAPDGSTTADKLVDNTISAEHAFYKPLITSSNNANVALSVYCKAAEYDRVHIRLDDSSADDRAHATFVLSGAGSIAASGDDGLDMDFTSAKIEALANGWYRCTVVGKRTTLGDIAAAVILVASGTTTTFAGTGSSGIHFWGVQVEAGSDSTSYIPTTSASVTRAADVVTFSDLTWFNGAQDSIYAEWIAKNVNNAKVWALDATNDKLLDEQAGMLARIAGATVANTAAAGDIVKAAARIVVNDYAISMNGGTVAADTSETAPGALTASRLGCDLAGANHLNSYIRRVAAFKGVAVADAALQQVSL